ncbi:NAD(P)H-quinone oxidoreductase [Rheinheimera sp. MMS21-TC3]|uniref:NAD(P)H-quinone oxidoreductase n=1 Tax=Rheinheimera sp. MMS21-TC3 TaxID=3072790 RepID=UPI0028C3B783|nr:NAD(P)H-quinone oxidoreductase [Rheinheimera sp. MMS21-TC3]WNO61245.1 NAD(P)H-quinone oxidoreductase [Rheinheimera sp. MMS21-TC3]
MSIPASMQAIIIKQPGQNSYLECAQIAVPKMNANQLLIKVAAAGVNRADLVQRQGLYPPPAGESDILGLEVAGTVVATPAELQHWIGKQVFGLVPGGGYAEYAVLHHQHAIIVPEGYSMIEAAATAEVFLTAYQLLRWHGQLSVQQKVLIHAGASGVGTAAIQLAKFFDAIVAVTASTDEKLALCRRLGADILVNYKQDKFEDVLAKCWPDGADLILDSVAGDYIHRNIAILGLDAKIVIYAMMGGRHLPELDLVPLFKQRGQLIFSTLRNRSDAYKANLTKDFIKNCGIALTEKKIQPIIYKTFNWQQAADAHQLMASNQTQGKLVLEF